MLRVLIAHNRYRTQGGEERHVDLLRRTLQDDGIDVATFFPDSASVDGDVSKRARAGLTMVYNPGGAGIGRALRAFRPDVVHFHNIWPLLTPAAIRLAKQAGAGTVLTAHNSRFGCPGGVCTSEAHPADNGVLANDCIAGSSLRCALVHNPRRHRVESVLYGMAQDIQRRAKMLERWVGMFIAPSRYAAAMLELTGVPRAKVRVIHNGISPRADDTPRGAEFGFFAGRITSEKGIPTLLDASKLAPDVPLAVAGRGPLEAPLKRSDITHLGGLTAAGVQEALSRAAFTVVPSTSHETLPYAALESLAAGKPVIATEVGGMPEIVRPEETGLLVPPGDAAALAGAMARLWRDRRLAEKLGAAGAAVMKEHFALSGQIERTRQTYREAIERAGRF